MLDVHLSGPVVGEALREHGHDVLAVDQSPELRELEDPELLRLAKEEGGELEPISGWTELGDEPT